ncbi:MAG: DMT family transporter [Gammaproteobacteria bacterium]
MLRAPKARDWFSLLILTVLWGSAFLCTELALNSFPPPVVVAGRILIAAVIVYSYLRFSGRALPRNIIDWLPMLVIAVCGNVLPFNLISWSQQHIDSSLAGVLMAVMPLFVLTLAHFFVPGSRLTRYRAAGFLLGFAGIVVVIGPDFTQGTDNNMALWGSLAALTAALSYAVSTIFTRRLGDGDPMLRAAGMLIVASVLSLPAAVIELPALNTPSSVSLMALGFLGVMATGFATLLYFRLIQGPGPAFLSLVNFLVPVWAVLAGAFFLGETLKTSVVAGLGLILSGIAISEFGARAISSVRSLRARYSTGASSAVAREEV